VFTAWLAKHRLDEMHELDMIDVNGGDRGGDPIHGGARERRPGAAGIVRRGCDRGRAP